MKHDLLTEYCKYPLRILDWPFKSCYNLIYSIDIGD